jgi:predicted RNase H-like HicB family nuclease
VPKIVVEKHPDTYVAYPLGLKGVVVGQGDTYEAALADVKSAIKFHIETFGSEYLVWSNNIDPLEKPNHALAAESKKPRLLKCHEATVKNR